MICFVWSGLTPYAVASIRQYIASTSEPVRIVSLPVMTTKTFEDDIAGCRVVWIERNESRDLITILGEMPRVIICSGWHVGLFNRYAQEVRRAGGMAICLCDNWLKVDLKLIPWLVRFRLIVSRRFDAYVVAGGSGYRLLRLGGVQRRRLRMGVDSGDDTIFRDGEDICKRPKKIIFVGRYVPVKNISTFMAAFAEFWDSHKDWSFELYGEGSEAEKLARICKSHPMVKISINRFMDSMALAQVYRDARVLVLPSYNDHWGVVVHEAALSGCALLLSTGVGSVPDLCNGVNGKVFSPTSKNEMKRCLLEMASWDDDRWRSAQNDSLSLARNFSPRKFSESITSLIKEYFDESSPCRT